MFVASKVSNNKYMVSHNGATRLPEVIPSDSLLRAVIHYLKTECLSKTNVYAFVQALNLMVDNLSTPTINVLLLRPSQELIVTDVIAGYKELERLIASQNMGRRANVSSAFRFFEPATYMTIAGGVLFIKCGFITRFKHKGVIVEMSSTPCISEDIIAVRIRSTNSRHAYCIFDPDALRGVLQSGGLLAHSLRQASESSQHTSIPDHLPQNWLRVLHIISGERDNHYIKHLLVSKPDEIEPMDVLRGWTQLEAILQAQKIKGARTKSFFFRNLLELGGNISSGVTTAACKFNSRFLTNGNVLDDEQVLVPSEAILVHVINGQEISIRFINQGTLDEGIRYQLKVALHRLSRQSQVKPVNKEEFDTLHRALTALSLKDITDTEFALPKERLDELSQTELAQWFIALLELLHSKFTRQTALPYVDAITNLLSRHSSLGEKAQSVYLSTLAVYRQFNTHGASIGKLVPIIDPACTEMSDLLTTNGVLQVCFSSSKWDVLIAGSQSTENYYTRHEVSKVLRFLADRSDMPYTHLILKAAPESITPKDVYRFYTEFEAVLGQRGKPSAWCKVFFEFIGRNSGPIHRGCALGCIAYNSQITEDNHVRALPYSPDREFALVPVSGHKKTKLAAFDPDFFQGIMVPGTLLSDCLFSAEKEIIHSVDVNLLNKQLLKMSESKLTALKLLLSSKKGVITPPMVVEGLIEYESWLEDKYAGENLYLLSICFRSFLYKLSGAIADDVCISDVYFLTRFNIHEKDQVRCIRPVTFVESTNSQFESVEFNSYLQPNFYKRGGLLAESLSALKVKHETEPYPMAQLQHWSTLIRYIIESHRLATPNPGIRSFFSKPLSDANRTKVILSLQTIESLIDLMDTSVTDKEDNFNAIKEFFTLSSPTISDGRTIDELDFRSRFATQPQTQNIRFRYIKKRNGVRKEGFFEWDLLLMSNLITTDGLLMTVIQKAANNSLAEPIQMTRLHTNYKWLRNISEELEGNVVSLAKHQANQPLRHLLTSQVAQISQRDVKLGLKRLEDLIAANPRKAKASASENLRKFLSVNAGTLPNGLTIGQCGFNTRFSARQECGDVELIIPIDRKGKPQKSPINQSHLSTTQLKDKINKFYQEPIIAIIEACNEEIQLFLRLKKELEPLVKRNDYGEFTYKLPEELREFVQRGDKTVRETQELIDRFGKKKLLAANLQLQAVMPLGQTLNCPKKSVLIPDEYKVWFQPYAGMRNFFWTPFFLPRQILLVCFIRLVLHTTWNKDVVATLRGKDLPYPLPPGRFFIQGHKDKVDKPTQPVEVTVNDKEVREALELLGIHHANMVAMELSPATVWVTPTSSLLSFLDTNTVQDFISRYHLPKFTLEQLAKHQINVRMGVDGSLFRSQAERNHAQVITTKGYVDHPLARIYYDANNAEFQRRLEATVIAKHEGSDALSKYGLRHSDIDVKLLEKPSDESDSDTPHWFLLGDGSTCTDIWASIDKASKNQKYCGGRKCHAGEDGCPYNKVIIGSEEFVLTLRKQRWFIERHEVLLSKYTREYFDEYIAPEMRFVFGLARYVETAEPEIYRDAVQKINQTMEGDE